MSRIIAWFYGFKKRHPLLVMVGLLYVLVPVLVGLALGYEMHGDSPVRIPTVVVNADSSQFSRDLIDYVDKTETFQIIGSAGSYDEAERLLQEGKALAGLIIPEDFYSQLLAGKSPDILLLYDGSQLAVVSVAKAGLSEIMLNMNGAYLQKVFAGKLGVLPEALAGKVLPISVTSRNLFNPTKSFRYYLLPGMLLAILQVGVAMLGAERAYERRRLRCIRRDFGGDILTMLQWAGMATLSIMLCLGVQLVCFGLPWRGTVWGGVALIFAYALTVTGLGYLVGTLVPERTFAIQLAAVTVLPTSVLAGYTYPLTAMPGAYQAIAKIFPFTYFSTDIRSLCLKPMAFYHLWPHIWFLLKYAAVEIILLLVIKWLLGRGADEEAAA